MENGIDQQSFWSLFFGDKKPKISRTNGYRTIHLESPSYEEVKAVKFDLNTPLLNFSPEPADAWTLADAVRGTQIFGSIGSGKSSGSGATIAKAFLRNGFGGLVLCGKADERENWENLAKAIGREDDLIVFSKYSGHLCNFLMYELMRKSTGGGETFNLVALFMTIYQIGARINGGESKESDRFWDNALRRLLIRTIDLIKFSGEDLSIKNMVEIINSAPSGHNFLPYLDGMTADEKHEWFQEGYCTRCLEAGFSRYSEMSDSDKQTFKMVYRYFLRDFAKLYDETRSAVIESFLGLAEPFLSGVLAEQFATGLNITPEITHTGKILIMDYPVKQYLEVGLYAQCIMKLLWQQATERRNIEEYPTPVFLWVDESQLFLSENDMLFQTTARSSRACTVFLTQNISNYYAVIGGNHPKARVDSLLGNLCTKIFHANNDYETNMWAANTIGKKFKNMSSFGGNISPGSHWMPSFGTNSSEQLHYQVEPTRFTILKCGGEEHNYTVEGVVVTAGKVWSNGKNYIDSYFFQT